MPSLIYYAHPMSWYDTGYETHDLTALGEHFGSDATIINPNSPFFREKVDEAKWHKRSTMQPFIDFIAQEKPAVAFRRFYDGRIGAGVAKEVLEALAWGQPVYELVGESDSIYVDDQWIGLTTFEEVLSIEENRSRIVKGEL